MKQWLVTLRQAAVLADFDRAADRLNCRRETGFAPVPLEGGDRVVRVTGPESVRRLLAEIPQVSDVHPEESLGLT